MTRTRNAALATLILVPALAVAGCGESEDNDFREGYNAAVKPLSELGSGIGSSIGGAEGKSNAAIEKEFQNLADKAQETHDNLAELEAQVRVNKAYIEACKDKYDRGELTAVDASIAKLTTTELQGKVADECLQLFGGYGYTTEYPISRDFVDARIQRIYGGTSEIMKEIIARQILGR